VLNGRELLARPPYNARSPNSEKLGLLAVDGICKLVGRRVPVAGFEPRAPACASQAILFVPSHQLHFHYLLLIGQGNATVLLVECYQLAATLIGSVPSSRSE
jgi:hypothetical protein